MGIARGWKKQVIRTNLMYAKRTVRIFSLSPSLALLFQSRSRTFVWLFARTWLHKNTDYFAVCTPYGRVRLAARARDSYARLNRFWEKTDGFFFWKLRWQKSSEWGPISRSKEVPRKIWLPLLRWCCGTQAQSVIRRVTTLCLTCNIVSFFLMIYRFFLYL